MQAEHAAAQLNWVPTAALTTERFAMPAAATPVRGLMGIPQAAAEGDEASGVWEQVCL